MSTPAKAKEVESNGNNHNDGQPKNPLLETLLEQDRTVSSTTDDLLDRARTKPDEFSKAFEKRVGALSGFAASLRPRK